MKQRLRELLLRTPLVARAYGEHLLRSVTARGSSPELAVGLRHIEVGSAVIDVGASYGLFSLAFAKACGPSGVVHAFEPNPDSAKQLRRVTWGTPVKVYQHALGDADGTAMLFIPQFSDGLQAPGFGTMTGAWKGAQIGIKVPVRRLDDVVPLEVRVSLIKIDVEGWELSVLAGATRLIADHRPIILLESEDRHLTKLGKSIDHLRAWCDRHAYECHAIAPERLMSWSEFRGRPQRVPLEAKGDQDAFLLHRDAEYIANFLLKPRRET